MKPPINLFHLFCLLAFSLANADEFRVNERDLYLGEAYFKASQGDIFDAISLFDIAFGHFYNLENQNFAPLYFQIRDKKYAVGDFERSYRMPRRAAKFLEAVANNNPEMLTRNEAAYQLAGVYLKMGEAENALRSIDLIDGKVSEELAADEMYLRAEIYMANGQFSGAIRLLQELKNADKYADFSKYNLGISLIKIGMEKQGGEQLNEIGRMSGSDEADLSLKDKANLTLGTRMLEMKQPAQAKTYLNRVRISSIYANRALFRSGWADAATGKYEEALTAWSALSKRSISDNSVRKSLVAVPYAYIKLNLPGGAASQYRHALETFDREMSKLDVMIKNANEGDYLKYLLNDEMRLSADREVDLAKIARMAENKYLAELLASKELLNAVENYFDLMDLQKRLDDWSAYLASSDNALQSGNSIYKIYVGEIRQLRSRVLDAEPKGNSLIENSKKVIGAMIVNELNQHRKQIQEYQTLARIGLIESYDRANQTHLPSGGTE